METHEAQVDDNRNLRLLKSTQLHPGSKVIVTITTPEDLMEYKEQWSKLSIEGLKAAYGENETEYSNNLIKEPNPEYKP